jgi:hypothetical protein
MKQIPIQQDNVTSLSADYFNDIPRELENLIQSAGIALATPPAGSDLNQAGKAVSKYVAGSDYYTCTNTADNFVLAGIGSFMVSPVLFVGLRIRFEASSDNAGTGVTIEFPGQSAVSAHSGTLANGATPSVKIGTMVEGKIVNAVYSKTPDGNTEYWRIECEEKVYSLGSGASFSMDTIISGSGLTFNGGPGAPVSNYRKEVFDVPGISWSVDPDTSNLYLANAGVALADLKYIDGIAYDVTYRWKRGTDLWHSAPLSCDIAKDGFDDVLILFSTITSSQDPQAVGASNKQIVIGYNSFGVD